MKQLVLLFTLLPLYLFAQDKPASVEFWDALKTHCGKAYEGTITAGGKQGDGFMGKKLVMHVSSCKEKTIRIPFFVGEDKSRTWVLSLQADNRILLKHDHRNKDGSEEAVTQYGGLSSNTGMANIQFFPADQHTSNLIPAASTNVWWFTIDGTSMTYNLRRIGSDRLFTVNFDLSQETATPGPAWGSE
ncbi:hypothetical protein [Aequorivita marina]|uniref:hypothetical protein n=1 Tax=Aequorivita marina TaxID=3073654 RepID=UPI00287569B7|nr:hypothetical protein [Aequorivita sp. S2608]MDS1299244.1 hypothetical protein [Aequorivita sp. S2608]